MKTKKKDVTKNAPPPTNEGGQGRVTAETIVTKGDEGMDRLRSMLKRVFVGAKRGVHLFIIW